MKKRLFAIVSALIICISLKAQTNYITLVVYGEGETKIEAISAALRSAIEQSFGTFVSANTSILNDEIVKDEIATVSSGNIQSYRELASVEQNNGFSVTLEATVSLGSLISYAKGKGSSCEFAGQTFAMNMKLKELNRQNELKVVKHLQEQVSAIAKDVFDLGIQAGEPILDGSNYRIPLTVSVSSNTAANSFFDMVTKTLSSLSLTKTERDEYDRSNIKYYHLIINRSEEGFYYDYHYWFRNDLTENIIFNILCEPLKNIYYTVQYSDKQINYYISPDDIQRAYMNVYGDLYPIKSGNYPYWSDGIRWEPFCLLQIKVESKISSSKNKTSSKKKERWLDKHRQMWESEEESFLEDLREKYGIKKQNYVSVTGPVPETKVGTSGKYYLNYYTDDSASKDCQIRGKGSSMEIWQATLNLDRIFSQPISPLFTFSIDCIITKEELYNLNGFSIKKKEN